MIVVMAERHIYMEMPHEMARDPNLMAGLDSANAAFRKVGTDRVAGIDCVIYDASNDDRKGQVCLSSDGVLLRAKGNDVDHGRELEATKVTYVAQPASLFEPPAGFQKMEIPTMPGGMPHGMGGAPMGPRGAMPGGPPAR